MADPWHFEKIALSSGVSLQVARAGSGPLLVMLHGFPECWYSWRHQIRALAPRFECIAPDLRGYGQSDAPRGVANYSIDKLVGDVAALIEACGRSRATIIAHDWGGAIAWAAAMMRPEIVERLVVMNCPHLARFQTHLRRDWRQMLRSWYILFFQLPWLPEQLFRAGNFAALERGLRGSAVQKAAFSDADLAVFRDTFRNPYSVTAAINYYRALVRQNFLTSTAQNLWLKRKISAPTMVVWGEQDVALRKALTFGMEPLFEGGFEIHYVPDSGHWVQQERPEVVNSYLEKFLSPLLDSRDG